MRFKFLGTGTSVGVPQIGCTCKVCTSNDPRDKRRRCGAYVQGGGESFVIDTPPEFREACVEYGISKVDAVVLTHAHMDHIAGFDDVRRFNTLNGTWVKCDPNEPGANGRTCRCMGKPMNCYAMPETVEAMHRIFPYIGNRGGANGLFRPMIDFVTDDEFEIGNVSIRRVRVEHGFPCCGYRVGNLGYVSDCHVLPDVAVDAFRGVETMVLNCLREREHPTHLKLSDSLAYLERIQPKRAYLIHMCHDFTYEEWMAKLPHGVEPAYDGLEIEC